MRLGLSFLLLIAAGAGSAQDRLKLDVNTETPEGQLLQKIGQEQDEKAKLALLEEFAAKHAAHAGYAWVLGQLAPALVKAQQNDRVFPLVEKLLTFDPSDAEMAYTGLQAAVAKDDAALIIQWANKTLDAARKGEKTPKPADEDDIPRWEYKVKFSQQVQERADYEMFAGALRSTDPAKRVQLLEALIQASPQGKLTSQAEGQIFLTYRQSNQNDKALALAERMVAKDAANEDMLLLLAQSSLEKKQNDPAIAYSDKLVALMKTKAAPEGVSAADWEKKKNTSLGAGLFMKGVALAGANKLSDADLVLREALPYLEGNEALLGPTLFQLGLANNTLGRGKKPDMKRIQDAFNFFKRAATIKGGHQGQAATNVKVMQQQFPVK